MWGKLRPDIVIDNYEQLNLKFLKEQGIKGIITDLDNTLVPWNERSAALGLKNWLDEVRRHGFSLCIVSNNSARRGSKLAEELEIPAVWSAVKPRRKAFRQALATLNLPPDQVAVLGDQLFTDILGGNRLNLFTILVEPISRQEFFGTRIMRLLEKIILKRK